MEADETPGSNPPGTGKGPVAGHRIEQWDCEPDLDSCSHFTAGYCWLRLLFPTEPCRLTVCSPAKQDAVKGPRAVGQALKKSPAVNNPLPPGGAAVGLGGFGTGALHTKKALLKLEGSLNRLEQQ